MNSICIQKKNHKLILTSSSNLSIFGKDSQQSKQGCKDIDYSFFNIGRGLNIYVQNFESHKILLNVLKAFHDSIVVIRYS